ncbi:MAG: hypothetical protein KDE58_27205 [Caldilineaceae bacterium]|nr:hypothetical protein [Caldilineaceae bacterium]
MTGIISHQLLFAQERQKDLLREAQTEQLIRILRKEHEMQTIHQPTQRFHRAWRRLVAGAAIGSALFLTACQPAMPVLQHEAHNAPAAAVVEIPEITIMAHDFSFSVPAEIEAGLVRIKLEDHGQEPHHVQFARLNDGVTFEQFMAALQKGENEALPLLTFPGGVAPIDPNGVASAILDLAPGNYVLLCLVPSPDGIPHLAKGMIAPVTVVEGGVQASTPEVQGTVKLVDFSFVLPSEIKAGKQIWEVVNEGSQLHEINLMKLADGKSMDDVAAWMAKPEGAPPFSNVGGFNGIDAKKVGYMELDLTPGTYVAICHVPDPASGKAHDALGMVMPFTVNE